MAQGEFALINQHLAAALQKPPIGWNPIGDHEILVLMADTAAIQQDIGALNNTAERAYEVSVQLGHRLYHAISLRALGTLRWLQKNNSAAYTHLQEALGIFQKLDMRWQAGRTLFELGELTARQGKKTAAAGYYTRALGEFEAMQARPAIERARAALAINESLRDEKGVSNLFP